MQIQLCEDDSLFHGGTPQLVVLVVKFDDGKTKRIPYEACKTIAALYQDLYAIAPQVAEASQMAVEDLSVEDEGKTKLTPQSLIKQPPNANKRQSTAIDRSNIIEKEDIVTMVKLHERDTTFSGTVSPLMVGMDYRVIEVFGPFHPVTQKRLPSGYDVIDDTAPTPERMRVFPDEVVLKSKRLSKVVEVIHKIEEILPCPACQVNNPLTLNKDEFTGTCQACGQDIVIARIIKKCNTTGCGQDVSCFDVGEKYEGKCGKCNSKIEVPYA